jgi:hypothetical protein
MEACGGCRTASRIQSTLSSTPKLGDSTSSTFGRSTTSGGPCKSCIWKSGQAKAQQRQQLNLNRHVGSYGCFGAD